MRGGLRVLGVAALAATVSLAASQQCSFSADGGNYEYDL